MIAKCRIAKIGAVESRPFIVEALMGPKLF